MVAVVREKPAAAKRARTGAGRLARVASTTSSQVYAALIEEARASGLLEGEKSDHVSFRAPPALIEAAKRQAGVSSTTELGLLALALLAQPDPVWNAMRRTHGRLGPDHQLEY